MTGTIRVVNTTKDMITLKSFDGDECDVLPSRTGPIEIDKKFDWNLPRGIKNMEKTIPTVAEVSVPAVKLKPTVPEVPATPLAKDLEPSR
jgi:hypothetical protein